MPKGTCRAEAMLNSEKIKPVALAVIESCLSEGSSQSVSLSVSQAGRQVGRQAVENSSKQKRNKILCTYWKGFRSY